MRWNRIFSNPSIARCFSWKKSHEVCSAASNNSSERTPVSVLIEARLRCATRSRRKVNYFSLRKSTLSEPGLFFFRRHIIPAELAIPPEADQPQAEANANRNPKNDCRGGFETRPPGFLFLIGVRRLRRCDGHLHYARCLRVAN